MANPTIGATTPRIQYTATASQTVFTVPFEFLANADLAVYVNGTLKTLTTDYTLTGANTTGGGTLTFVTGRTAGDIVTILGNLAYSRDTNKYTKYGLLPAEVLEADFDAMQVQAKQLARDGQFALRAPLTDTGSPSMTLPVVATRASKALGFDASGNPTVSASSLADIDAATQIVNTIGAAPAGDAANVSYTPAGTGAVSTNVQTKLRETISVMDFGAVGNGVTDDTAAIQAAIDYALSTNGVRRILFKWNHLVTDINLTKKYNCGLIFEGLNASNQDGTGSNDEGTIIVSGASSQGFDLSGSTGITFKNLTISGDAAAPPRCGIFMCRVSGSNEAFGHMFENVNSYGSFTYANVYNYAGEGGTWKSCNLTNDSTVGHVWYGTSKNSLGLSSKFQAMDESATPLTVTNFQDCEFINASGAVASTSTYGVWFERDAVRSGDRTISNINFQSCYFNGAGTASVHVENVDNDVAFVSCTDESYATANPYGNVSAVKVSGASYLIGLVFINNTIFGARTNILLGDNIKNLVWLGNYCYNNKGVTITNLDGAFVSKWLTVNGTFTVTTTAPRCFIYTENSGTDNSYINLGTYANCAAADRRLNSPSSAVTASQIGQLVFDYAHKRFFIAQAGGQFDWAEVIQPIRSNSNPSSGNWVFGQIATLYDFGTLTAGSGQGLICNNTGTAGTLVGVTGSITSGTTALTLNTSSGISVGNYITIAGVSGRKQIRTLVGTAATIDTNADATVSGAAVAYSAPSFVEFGTVKLQGSASWTPGAITTGSRASTTLTASGAVLGDLAVASFSLDVQGCSISAYVSSSNTVTVVLTNDTGSTQTLSAGTVRARVFKQ